MLTWPQPTKGYRLEAISISNDYNVIEKMLLYHHDDIIKDTHIIEQIYGLALYRSNERIISLVNLFVRENKIKINRYNVLFALKVVRLSLCPYIFSTFMFNKRISILYETQFHIIYRIRHTIISAHYLINIFGLIYSRHP